MTYRITVPRVVNDNLDFDGAHFLLKAPFAKDSWINDLAAGSWDKENGVWKLPPYIVYARTVLEQLPELAVSDDARAALEAPLRWDLGALIPQMLSKGALDQGAAAIYMDRFYPYQREATDWLFGGPKDSGLVALSPGLGKTIVTLVAARLRGLNRVLIVAPRPLLRTWENEAMKFFGEVWFERRQGMVPTDAGWTLTSYETVVGAIVPAKDGKPQIIRGQADAYRKVHWDLVVLDESVLVKNRDAKRFKQLEKLRRVLKRPDSRWWELSGSPTTRYYDDLWTQLHLIDPKGFAGYWRFTNRYCYVMQDVWGTQITGNRANVDILGDLADVMFVRNQEEVLPDLPEEIPELVEVEILPKQLKAYDEMANDFCTRLESGSEVKTDYVIAQLTRLQQITSNLINLPGGTDESAKADALCEMVEARSFSFPAIIWTHWLPGARALSNRLNTEAQKRKDNLRIEWIHGATTEAEERENEELFENYMAGGIDILILSLAVGKFGHNLQITRTSVYMDKTWDADAYVQSMKRVKRIGLDHRPVVITLKDPRTVDQLVEDNLSGKFPGIAKVTNANLASMLRHLRGGQA